MLCACNTSVCRVTPVLVSCRLSWRKCLRCKYLDLSWLRGCLRHASNMPSFSLQFIAFYALKHGLCERKRYPFAWHVNIIRLMSACKRQAYCLFYTLQPAAVLTLYDDKATLRRACCKWQE